MILNYEVLNNVRVVENGDILEIKIGKDTNRKKVTEYITQNFKDYIFKYAKMTDGILNLKYLKA